MAVSNKILKIELDSSKCIRCCTHTFILKSLCGHPAIGAIKIVVDFLPKLMQDLSNIEYRAKLQLASHMAGVAFNISSLG